MAAAGAQSSPSSQQRSVVAVGLNTLVLNPLLKRLREVCSAVCTSDGSLRLRSFWVVISASPFVRAPAVETVESGIERHRKLHDRHTVYNCACGYDCLRLYAVRLGSGLTERTWQRGRGDAIANLYGHSNGEGGVMG